MTSRATAAVRSVVDPPARTARQRSRHELFWGVGAVVVSLVVALIAIGIYVFTPGQVRVVAQFAEAGQLRVGDDVRVAGVAGVGVGAVKKITLRDDHVDVEMFLRKGVFIGADSRVDVKMLTVVGGSFVDIASMGQQSLGDRSIPVSHTSIPYSLMSTFQIVTPKVRQIDGAPLREVLVQFQQGLSANPGRCAAMWRCSHRCWPTSIAIRTSSARC
ncbi:MlaD family protein [Gordonia bronchialis]|uniref:MlaD family protein n=1 Tax=Gordonia bronchialis TaxID=2054 RepID=UPI00019B935B|nr:MlaD family protein [Gordonia bronchialis]MCC3323284.1 MlaD family protein [Gordonia bronchialis]